MPHQWIRCNLAAAAFPFISDLWGQSVMVPALDENYEALSVSSVDQSRFKGIPQVYYAHNVMPSFNGFQAIGWTELATPVAGETLFDTVFPLINSNLHRALFSPAHGKCYVYDSFGGANGTAQWQSVADLAISEDALVTTAFVNGQTYIYIQSHGCFTYADDTASLEPVNLQGIIEADILGICEANGYMIAVTDNAVAWSSQIDPTDFRPSLVTGAGGGNIQGTKGSVIAALNISGGFLVYCEQNVIGFSYTGNSAFPFTDLEIPGSSGIANITNVTFEANLNIHYAWTKGGLQAISLSSGTTNIYPEVTEFLTRNQYEDFDDPTLTFSIQNVTQPLATKVNLVFNQYLVVSYGIGFLNFTYALVFDLNLQRWGKIKIDHVDVFQWNAPGNNTDLTYAELIGNYSDQTLSYAQLSQIDNNVLDARKTISFLQQDGTVQSVNFNASNNQANGTILFGKYQVNRNHGIEHQRTLVENANGPAALDVTIWPTLDGKTFLPPVKAIRLPGLSGTLVQGYAKRVCCYNFSIMLQGQFDLVSLETDVTIGLSL